MTPTEQLAAADKARADGDQNPKPTPKEEIIRLQKEIADRQGQIKELEKVNTPAPKAVPASTGTPNPNSFPTTTSAPVPVTATMVPAK